MDILDRLIREHAELRGLAQGVADAIGPETGVGWEDQSPCDLPALCSAQRRLHERLREHERAEERAFLLAGAGAARREQLARAHASLEQLDRLLGALSECCDGRHVYKVRSVASQLRQELEAHMSQEERELFPLLRGLGPAD